MRRALAGVSVGWLGLSMIGDGIPALLLPHQLLSTGRADATTLGLVSLLAIGLGALVQPFAGRLGDARGRAPVIGVGLGVALFGLLGLLLPSAALAAAIVAVVGVGVVQAGQQPLLPDLVPARWRGRGAGLKGAVDVGGAFLGFVVLAALLGAGQPLLAVAVLAIVLVGSFAAAFALLRGRWPAGSRPVRARPLLDLSVRSPFLQLVVARFLFLLGIYVVGRFLVLFVAQRFGLGADAAAEQGGIVLAVLTLATVLVSLPAGWLADRIGRGRLMLIGGVTGAAGMALLPLGSEMIVLILLGALVAVGSAAFSAGSWATLTDLAEGDDAGRLLGLASWGTAGAAAAAGLAGPLIDIGERAGPGAGFVTAFLLAGLLAVVGGVLGWRLSMEPAAGFAVKPSQGVS
jgi:MFS family permease